MTVAYLGATTANASALGVITRPASVVDNSLMVVSVHGSSTGDLVTAPSGWTLIGEDSGVVRHVAVWTRFVAVAASEPATYTFSVAQRATMMVFSGVAPDPNGAFSSFELVRGYTTSSAFTNTLASQTSVINGQLLVGGMSVRTTTGAVTPVALPTGWTQRGGIAGTSAIYAGTLAAPAIGGTTGTQAFTGNDSDNTPGWVTAWMGLLTPVRVSAPLSTATGSAPAPEVRGGARTSSTTSLATSAQLDPTLIAIRTEITVAVAATATSEMSQPTLAGGAVATATAMDASMAMTVPSAIGAALLGAVASTATSQAEVPSAILSQSIAAPLMSMVMMAHGSETLGGALVSPDVSAVIASIHAPLTQLFYPIPLMSMSASAFEATALGSAVTTTLLGVATASAVAPRVGVLRTTSAWRGNRMSVNGRVNTGSVTTRPSSSAQVTRNTNDASSTLRAGVTVSPSSPRGVTATQQERDE